MAEEPISFQPTNTIPVFYISTDNYQPIVDKENYVDATFYISVPDSSRFSSVASETEPATLQIRGRGNASWILDKKPYKLKLTEKTELLGMPRHRHFALLACHGAAYEIGLFSYMAGLKIAELTGQDWAPRCEPVELVLNGEYCGLYLLTESVKIDKNRVNISKQPDNCDDPEKISGGWLVEIDNYVDPNQILIPEYLEYWTSNMKLTYKSPEVLSDLQQEWLTQEFTNINNTLNLQSEINDDWADFIEPSSIARYFIVREMMHDTDGYNGSFYLHKDFGNNTKWICGPMWDIYPITPKSDWVMNDHPSYSQVHYIPYISKTASFKRAVVNEWSDFKEKLDSLYSYIDSFTIYRDADRCNGELWGRNGDCDNKIDILKRYLAHNAEWIDTNLDQLDVTNIETVWNNSPENMISLNGRLIEFNETAKCMSILDISGRIVKTENNIAQCDLSDLIPGLYIVRFEIENTGVATAKINLR